LHLLLNLRLPQSLNGITSIFTAKALNKGIPKILSKGILTEPPPIPKIPLIKPAVKPTPAYNTICSAIITGSLFSDSSVLYHRGD